jgi:hypothetical protein
LLLGSVGSIAVSDFLAYRSVRVLYYDPTTGAPNFDVESRDVLSSLSWMRRILVICHVTRAR